MRLKVVALALALVLALAVPTAAVTGSEDDAGAISMAPHSGPNGEYATVTGGEIEVAFDELNEDAVTTADRVFTITAEANESLEVWVEIDGVRAYVGDDPADRIDSEGDAVVLAPNETVAVGFQIDTNGANPDPGSMTVHATEPDDAGSGSNTSDGGGPDLRADVTVTNGSVPWERIVTVTVTNDGTATGIYEADLRIDETLVASETLSVPAGERRTTRFTYRFDRPGRHEIGVAGETRVVDVHSGAPGDGQFRVTDLSAASTTLATGESTTVTATVENTGDTRGTYTAVLTDNGTVVAEQSVTVPAGETRTVSFEPTFETPGAHELAVGDASTTVEVRSGAALIEVTAVEVTDRAVTPGETTTVVATVENTAERPTERTIRLSVAGVVVDAVDVAVPGGETRTVRFERPFETPGVYPVAVEGMAGGDIVVRAGGTTANRVLTGSLGVTVLVPVLLGLLLALWRRQRLVALLRPAR